MVNDSPPDDDSSDTEQEFESELRDLVDRIADRSSDQTPEEHDSNSGTSPSGRTERDDERDTWNWVESESNTSQPNDAEETNANAERPSTEKDRHERSVTAADRGEPDQSTSDDPSPDPAETDRIWNVGPDEDSNFPSTDRSTGRRSRDDVDVPDPDPAGSSDPNASSVPDIDPASDTDPIVVSGDESDHNDDERTDHNDEKRTSNGGTSESASESGSPADSGRIWDRIQDRSESIGTRSDSDSAGKTAASDAGGSSGSSSVDDLVDFEDTGSTKPNSSEQRGPVDRNRWDELADRRSSSGTSLDRTGPDPSSDDDLSELEWLDESVLVLTPFYHPISERACARLIESSGTRPPNVLFVSVDDPAPNRLEVCQRSDIEDVGELAVIEMGSHGSGSATSQTSTDDQSIAVTQISKPSNLPKLGIVISKQLSAWEGNGRPTVLCFHSLTAMLQYVSTEKLFRFLHVLGGKLRSSGGVGHYHMDLDAHSDRVIGTFEPVFDSVARISGDGSVQID